MEIKYYVHCSEVGLNGEIVETQPVLPTIDADVEVFMEFPHLLFHGCFNLEFGVGWYVALTRVPLGFRLDLSLDRVLREETLQFDRPGSRAFHVIPTRVNHKQ